MIKSFRLRLTAWYLAFFSLLFLIFSVFLYGVLSRALEKRLDESLAAQAVTTAGLFQDELEEMHGDAPLAAANVVSDMRVPDGAIAVFEKTRLLAAGGPVPARQLEGIAAAPAGMIGVSYGKYGARAAVHRLATSGRDFLIVALAPRDSIAAELGVVRRSLFFALPLLVALAGLGGYVLASRSLAPLGWMAEQAHKITDSNLDARLEIGDAAQELAVLAASFNALLSRLDRSFESMRRFVADASHELRTPISVIRGEADVALSHQRSAAEYQETLAIILDESRRLSRLVDDLLNMARADAGRVRLQVQEFYLNDLLAECCRAAQTLAGARRIDLECRPGDDVAFRGDEELLRRLVMNLLDNAIRYTPPGGKVSAALEQEGTHLRIRVSDTGVGIAADAAPHVFERFYRADKARSRQDGGFGLGLSIVKWIAESHNGDVVLASRPGSGSTFTVSLPRD